MADTDMDMDGGNDVPETAPKTAPEAATPSAPETSGIVVENEAALATAFYTAANALMDVAQSRADPAECARSFSVVLQASRWPSPSIKLLAARAVPQYAAYFTSMYEQALDAQLDMCEDDAPAIRIEAIKHMPILCEISDQFSLRIADALCQLLQIDAKDELGVIRKTLHSIFIKHSKPTLEAILNQIAEGSPDISRNTLAFLIQRYHQLPHNNKFNASVSTSLIKALGVQNQILIADLCSAFKFLRRINAFNTPGNRDTAMKIILDHLEQQVDDEQVASSLNSIFAYCLAIFRSGTCSGTLLNFLFTHFLDNGKFAKMEVKQQFTILKMAAEISMLVRNNDIVTKGMAIVDSILQVLVSNKMLATQGAMADLNLCEPVIYMLSQFDQKTMHVSVSNEAQLSRFRFLFVQSYVSTIDFEKGVTAHETNKVLDNPFYHDKSYSLLKRLLCVASNVNQMTLELLKPGKMRQPISVVLSWTPLISENEVGNHAVNKNANERKHRRGNKNKAKNGMNTPNVPTAVRVAHPVVATDAITTDTSAIAPAAETKTNIKHGSHSGKKRSRDDTHHTQQSHPTSVQQQHQQSQKRQKGDQQPKQQNQQQQQHNQYVSKKQSQQLPRQSKKMKQGQQNPSGNPDQQERVDNRVDKLSVVQ